MYNKTYYNAYLFIAGILLIIFGIIKLIVSAINIILTKNNSKYFDNIYIINNFVIHDYSVAGKIFSVVILLFSIYTLIKGLFLINFLKNEKLIYFISNETYIDMIYLILGIFLILFYSFIIYTPSLSNNIINKDENYNETYKIVGIGTGLLFIITLLCRYIYFYYTNIIILILSIIILVALSYYYYYILLNNNSEYLYNHLTTTVMIIFTMSN